MKVLDTILKLTGLNVNRATVLINKPRYFRVHKTLTCGVLYINELTNSYFVYNNNDEKYYSFRLNA